MTNFILGRYIPGNSLIHRMDPRSKFLSLFIFVLLIFWANNLATNLLLVAFVLFSIFLTGVPFSFFIKGLKPMLFFIGFTTLFQLFFIPGNQVVFKWGMIQVTDTGLSQALIIFIRFILIIFLSTVLTITTTPLNLADAIESLLSPLRKIGFPVHEIGLMLSMSLRFVPTLMDDTTRIMNAQRARGVDFDEGNLIQKVKSLLPILIPLFASSFKRADALATAMESRGYQGGDGRSKYRTLKWTKLDTATILIFIFLSIATFLLKN